MIKSTLKNIRKNKFVNSVLRTTVKGLQKSGLKINTTHLTVSGIVTISLPENKSIKLYSEGNDYIPSITYWNGFDAYEKSVIPFYYIAKKANTIVDIGANIGYFSLLAKAANSEAKVYAFEPVPRIAKRLLYQNKLNNFDINIVESVVGDSNEPVTFYIPKGDTMALAASTKKGWVSDVEEVQIPSVTLDLFTKKNNLPKVDLIKMDCEFHELEVLKGMKKLMEDSSPVIMSEVLFPGHHGVDDKNTLNQFNEIQELMIEAGFYFYQVKEDHLKRIDSLQPNDNDRNYFFSKVRTTQEKIPFNEAHLLLNNEKRN